GQVARRAGGRAARPRRHPYGDQPVGTSDRRDPRLWRRFLCCRPQRMGSGESYRTGLRYGEEHAPVRRSKCEADVSLKLFALTCGHLTGDLGYLMEGGEGPAELPIPAYLIEHPKGTVLFDTGMHPQCQHDPAGRVGERVMGLFSFHYQPGEEISARLEAIDRDPGRIDVIVNSHFHFDHVGGNALIPNAVMVVQKREWAAGMDPDIAALRG